MNEQILNSNIDTSGPLAGQQDNPIDPIAQQPSIVEPNLAQEEQKEEKDGENEKIPHDASQKKNKRGPKGGFKDEAERLLYLAAQEALKQNQFNMDYLYTIEEFKVFKNNVIFDKKMKKWILNAQRPKKQNKIKSLETKSQTQTEVISNKDDNKLTVEEDKASEPFQEYPFLKARTPIKDKGATINSDLISTYIKEYQEVIPSNRYSFLDKIMQRNTQALIDFLVDLKQDSIYFNSDGLFGLIQEIIINNDLPGMIKTRLFAHSLLFYKHEVFIIDDCLLKSTIQYLTHNNNSAMITGLANLIFQNDTLLFSKLENEIISLDKKNIGIIQLMSNTFHKAEIDRQVIQLLPSTILILNQPFIKLLKETHGMIFIKHIDSVCYEYVIKICALVSANDYQTLKTFVNRLRDILIEQWDFMDSSLFAFLLQNLSMMLENRDKQWVGKVSEITLMLNQVVDLLVNKRLQITQETIMEVLFGDSSKLISMLEIPMQMDEGINQLRNKVIDLFNYKNSKNPIVLNFIKMNKKTLLDAIDEVKALETSLFFGLHIIQYLCINHTLSSGSQFNFNNFGIGNGKTLLCAVLAILLAKKYKCQVFIVSKLDHLIMRDQIKYSPLIMSQGLQTNINSCLPECGVYFYSETKIHKELKDDQFKQQWKNSIIIVDEFDWILFEGTPKVIKQNLIKFQKASKVIGFTGSSLTLLEEECLRKVYNSEVVQFPSLIQIEGDKKVHLTDIIVNTTKIDYIQELSIILRTQLKYSPIIIVANASYNLIKECLSKIQPLSINAMKDYRGPQLDAQLKQVFLTKDINQNYGVYLLTESQGRGTDFSTDHNIESNGGNQLIMTDVFNLRSQEQIIGRIGRLGKKGKWNYLLYQPNALQTVEQIVNTKQQEFLHQNHIRLSNTVQLLNEKPIQKQQTINANLDNEDSEGNESDKDENEKNDTQTTAKPIQQSTNQQSKVDEEDKKDNENDTKTQNKSKRKRRLFKNDNEDEDAPLEQVQSQQLADPNQNNDNEANTVKDTLKETKGSKKQQSIDKKRNIKAQSKKNIDQSQKREKKWKVSERRKE